VSRRRPIGDRLADAAARLRRERDPIVVNATVSGDPNLLAAALDHAVRKMADEIEKRSRERYRRWSWGETGTFAGVDDDPSSFGVDAGLERDDPNVVETTARIIPPALPAEGDDE
jgi:hypothetical protein